VQCLPSATYSFPHVFFILQYTCLGKVSYSRSSPIHKLTELQIEDALLAMQAGRREPAACSSSSSKIGAPHADSDVYSNSHYEALSFKEEADAEFDGDDSFLDRSPENSLRRFASEPPYSKLSAEEWGSNLFRWALSYSGVISACRASVLK
jgi:hypothetical protein